jgi:Zn-dependent membrane protease YugP
MTAIDFTILAAQTRATGGLGIPLFMIGGLIFILVLGFYAQWRVKAAFQRYAQVPANSGLTGAEAAARIMSAAGIHDVEIVETNDFLGDHYDPSHKRLCLSSDVYHTPSVAALGIAAHEVGHAIQHKIAYAPLRWRMAAVPLTVTASNILPWVMIGGFFFHGMMLVTIGFYCYLVITLFQLVTLPVEFDASRRAKVILGQMGMIQPGEEAAGVNRVLNSAALTYVAAFVASLYHLIRLYLIMNSSRERE